MQDGFAAIFPVSAAGAERVLNRSDPAATGWREYGSCEWVLYGGRYQ